MASVAQPGIELSRWQRLLLPGGMLRGGRRSLRDWIVDVLMFAIALGLGAVVLSQTWDEHSTATAIVDIVLGVVTLVALWFRRTHPVAVITVAIVASSVSAFAAGPGLMAFFNAALRLRGRTLAWVVAGAYAATIVYTVLYPDDDVATGLAVGFLINAVVLGWGMFVRVQRDLVRSLQESALQREAEHQLHVEQAREAERRRIAREMHDVLAHRISLLSLHAGALEFRPDAPPEEIAEAAGVIRAAAHAALDELREVIGVLRESGELGAVEPPQPTLARIPALIEESRAAGMRVHLSFDGPDDDALPVALGRTAYRIVQEGLTNARKHAPGAAVDVSVGTDEGELLVTVATRPAVGVVARGPALPGTGTGLIGLTERVALAGGTLEHGPDASGDFVLRASLPRGSAA